MLLSYMKPYLRRSESVLGLRSQEGDLYPIALLPVTFLIASIPFRAVAMTRNSPVLFTTSLITRRKKGLSSTTRTVGGRSEGATAMGHR